MNQPSNYPSLHPVNSIIPLLAKILSGMSKGITNIRRGYNPGSSSQEKKTKTTKKPPIPSFLCPGESGYISWNILHQMAVPLSKYYVLYGHRV